MVKYVTINGKEYPVRVSYLAIKKLAEENKIKLAQVDTDNMNPEMMEGMLYYALVSGARAEGQQLDLTRQGMENALDDCFMEFMELIPLFFPTKKEEESSKNE